MALDAPSGQCGTAPKGDPLSREDAPGIHQKFHDEQDGVIETVQRRYPQARPGVLAPSGHRRLAIRQGPRRNRDGACRERKAVRCDTRAFG